MFSQSIETKITRPLFALWILSVSLFSCISNDAEKQIEVSSEKTESIAPYSRVLLSALPDSLQPSVFQLIDMPAPLKVDLSNAKKAFVLQKQTSGLDPNITFAPPLEQSLPFLKNDKGEPILDKNGNPMLMGYGGKSHFTSYTTQDGLALDAIKCSMRDHLGNLWFGTFGAGVSRYDGKSFVNYTSSHGLANNLVYSIIEDHDGSLWFGTDGGVSLYDGQSFKTFKKKEDGLLDDRVFCLLADSRGAIWMGTLGGGLIKFENNTFTNYSKEQGLPAESIHSLFEDKNGVIWIGTTEGLCSLQNDKFTKYTQFNGVPSIEIRAISEDKEGNMWFATPQGVIRFNGQSFQTYTTNDGLVNNDVHGAFTDRSGDVWFATVEGVSHFFNDRFINFTPVSGFAKGSVNSIVDDSIGNLWFGTYTAGIVRYDGEAFVNFTSDVGVTKNSSNSFTEDQSGNIWFGTYGAGAIRFDGKSYAHFTKQQGIGKDVVFSVFADAEGNVWMGTYGGGVSKFDGKTVTSYTTKQGLPSNVVLCIDQDSKGNLWFGNADGSLCCFDGKSFTNYATNKFISDKTIRSLFIDKSDNVWLGIYGGGACVFDGESFTALNTKQGLMNDEVWSISQDQSGNMWFATTGGLSVLSNDQKNAILDDKNNAYRPTQLFSSFNTSDGLPDDFVTNIIQLPNGKTAIGTNLGIAIFNLSNDHEKLINIETYNSSHGFPVRDVNVGNNAMFVDSKGIIWAGTGSEQTAVVRFDYSALNRSKQEPSVVIQSVRINDEAVCWFNLASKGIHKTKEDSLTAVLQEFIAYGNSASKRNDDSLLNLFSNVQFERVSKFYPLPINMILPYDHNHISFDFNAIEPSDGERVSYQFMLEGYSKVWSPVTSQTSATFGNIPEGNYTFKIKALGASGVWTSPVAYSFQVLPPWYRTWWSYVLYGCVFVLGIGLFSRWRETKLRQEKEKLEKTVEERTAELVQKNILVEKQKAIVEQEKKRSDDLLLNILPEEVAEELKQKGSADAKQFEEVTVLFTDFQDFTSLSEKLTAKELVEEINTCFMAFDKIIDKYGIEKIKTIGDSYMCAGGLPTTNETHAEDIIHAALDIQQFIQEHIEERSSNGRPPFRIRIGIHTGPVVAGIVGIRKFAYDIWGDTVNTASRMESSGEAGRINVSASTYALVKDKFNFEYRGKINAKGKGEMDMYFVEGRA